MGVGNLLDPEQSLRGGAEYLNLLRDRLPNRIIEPERTKMALAAYNVGYGHLEDVRILTQQLGGNPDQWADIEKNLPLLTQKKYYQTLNYGYARGYETLAYVGNIYYYKSILRWHQWMQIAENYQQQLTSKDQEQPVQPPEWLSSSRLWSL